MGWLALFVSSTHHFVLCNLPPPPPPLPPPPPPPHPTDVIPVSQSFPLLLLLLLLLQSFDWIVHGRTGTGQKTLMMRIKGWKGGGGGGGGGRGVMGWG